MSVTEAANEQGELKGRKRNAETAEIEIDVDAPEPPSKKALRKAKRTKPLIDNDPQSTKAVSGPSLKHSEPLPENQRRSPYGIWIGNLSFSTTKDDLVRFFTTNSQTPIAEEQITRIHLPPGPVKFGKATNKGFSYVDFTDEATLNVALQFSEGLLDGRRVLIKNAKSFEGRPEKKAEDDSQKKAPSKRIFVGNLDFDATMEDLEEHFGVCGTIEKVHMATFEDSGKCKGFAWVDFTNLASAEAAMRGWVEPKKISQVTSSGPRPAQQRIWLRKLKGRQLRMEFAEDKVTRYQKRYGKNAKTKTQQDEETEEPIREVDDVAEPLATKSESKRPPSKKRKPEGKYTEETVQRLTGAIIESKGQRTVFE
ncbi:nucleolin [Exophiala viscosa]|uniref:Nucleolin n=1 Tax=Exophiala viscosa TaxID=2486360 RepID=A0AAN6DLQ3_9EURO|nr:nucleolin [Exophiala viscosa]